MKLPNTAEGAKEGIGHSCHRLPRILRFGPIDCSVLRKCETFILYGKISDIRIESRC